MEQADKKITKFLKVSNELERYLHNNGSLTPLQLQTIETTIIGLRTLLQSWTIKHRPDDVTSIPGRLTRKAQEP